jgi:DNA-binding NtrC family response regulator
MGGSGMGGSGALRVFVVDDDAIIAETLNMIFAQDGFAVESFSNPLEALEAAETACPDVLVSDVVMPQLSGVELAMRYKKICPSGMVLLISAQAATVDLLEPARRNGYSFQLYGKPIDPGELISEIRKFAEIRKFGTAMSPRNIA